MTPIIVNFQQGTPEWHSWRMSGIGGSDAPVIEGSSPYKTPRQLFYEKSGSDAHLEEDEWKEFIFAKGHRTEAIVRKHFQELVRGEVNPVCMQHGNVSYFIASLDGLSNSHGVLEGKLVGKDVLKAAIDLGEIPRHHWVQMQHQFIVSGADIGQWYGHNGKDHGALIEVRPDQEFMLRQADATHTFWADLKAGRVPPLSERDYLIPDDDSLLAELRDAKVHAENAQAYFEALRDKAVSTYGHGKIAGAGVKLYKTVRKGSLSLLDVPEIRVAAEAVKASLPAEHVESFRKSGSESWTLRIDSVKSKETA